MKPFYMPPLVNRTTLTYRNGYGVSIRREPCFSTLFEVAVLHQGRVVYNTPITGDVLRRQTPMQVAQIIERVNALPMARFSNTQNI
jgi:hypothetical protein